MEHRRGCAVWHENCSFAFSRDRMIRHLVFLAALPVLIAPWAGRAEQKQNQPRAEQKAKTASLTGCIDEQQGRYILVDDRSLNPIANLEAEGFPTEGFAKHMGHKVTVRGISIPGGAVPVFKVRSIETVSETCAPQP